MKNVRGLTEGRQGVMHPCEGDELRCLCGSLLARVTRQGIELKCRRCKRVLVVPVGSERIGEGNED